MHDLLEPGDEIMADKDKAKDDLVFNYCPSSISVPLSAYVTSTVAAINFKETNKSKYSRMDQVKFVEDSLQKILLCPFLNTLSQMKLRNCEYMSNTRLADFKSSVC